MFILFNCYTFLQDCRILIWIIFFIYIYLISNFLHLELQLICTYFHYFITLHSYCFKYNSNIYLFFVSRIYIVNTVQVNDLTSLTFFSGSHTQRHTHGTVYLGLKRQEWPEALVFWRQGCVFSGTMAVIIVCSGSFFTLC